MMTTRMTPELKFKQLFYEMTLLCEQEEWGDWSSYARSKEIFAAIELDHRVAPHFSGADGLQMDGPDEYEYKSTNDRRCKGAYTGISVQATWEEQDRYLREDKILKYARHYYNRFEGGKLVESWYLTGQQAYDILKPKLQKKYATVLKKKDPRLSANVTWTDIKNNGVQVINNGKRIK